MSTESEKKGIEASFKSMDTEEFLDIYFNRPIGYAWALLFKKLKVHPNVVTIFSIILGIGAGVMFYYPDMKHTLIGILLLMWANHYDITIISNTKYNQGSPISKLIYKAMARVLKVKILVYFIKGLLAARNSFLNSCGILSPYFSFTKA